MTYPANHYSDPTNVTGKRIGGWVIDLLIFLVFTSAFVFVTGDGPVLASEEFTNQARAEQFCEDWEVDHPQGSCVASDGVVLALEVPASIYISFFLHFIAYVVISGLTGGSLGKQAVGLRVVTADGRLAGTGKHLLRTVMWVADAVTCALPILGGILMLSTKGHRRIGDMAASTFVIDKEGVDQPVVVPGLNAPWAPAPAPAPGAGLWPTAPGASVAAQPANPPTGDGPVWDEARNAYIQYDHDRGAWLQWNEAANEWRPIEQ